MATDNQNGSVKTNGHVHADRLQIHNIGPFDDYELLLGHFTLVEGANAEGKTTIVRALESLVEGGNPQRLIKNGEDEARISLLLSNGILYKKTLRRGGKSELKESHPEFGAISAAQTHLEKMIVDSFAVNPSKLIMGTAKQRVDYLLSKIPIEAPKTELEAIVIPGTRIPDGHALTVLPELRKDLEMRRRTKRQQMEDKQGECSGLEQALPSGDVPDIDRALADARKGLLRNEDEQRASVANATREFDNSIQQKQQELIDFLHQGEIDLERAIAKLKEEWNVRAATQRDLSGGGIKELLDRKHVAENNAWQQFETSINDSRAEITRLEQVKEQEVRNEHTRELLKKAREQEERFSGEWKDLDRRIKSLDALHASLTAELPIHGLTIGEDGDLAFNGVTWEQVNLARKIDIGVQLAELLADIAEFPFLIFDDLEHLDAENFDVLSRRIRQSNMQSVGVRVKDGPLTVTRFEREEIAEEEAIA